MSEAQNNQAPEATNIEHVTITVDGQEVQAPKGAMLIEVTDAQNIKVPRFCYHKKLAVAANCRMCLVEVEKAPKTITCLCDACNGWHGGSYTIKICQRCTKISNGIFTD